MNNDGEFSNYSNDKMEKLIRKMPYCKDCSEARKAKSPDVGCAACQWIICLSLLTGKNTGYFTNYYSQILEN
jgi:hypothetical protein